MLVFFVLFLSSCGSTGTDKNPMPSYQLDMEGILVEQIEVLNKLNPEVQKVVYYDSLKEERAVKNIEWEEELNILWEYDLKQTKFDRIFKEEVSKDSGVLVVNYKQLKPLKDMEVNMYTVSYDLKNRIKSLKIVSEESNFFFSKRNILEVDFGLYDGQFPIINSYHFERKTDSKWFGRNEFKLFTNINIH